MYGFVTTSCDRCAGASLAGTFARQTGRVFVFAYRHVPCPWGAPVELLNLLARFALIPPDVGIEIRKVGPVHCLRSLTLCARVAALQLHQSLKFNPSPSPFWRQFPSCLKMSWIIKRLPHTSCREGRWKYGRRWALAWPELGQLGSIWTPECCTKMSGGRICETFPAHRGAQILSDDVEFVSALDIRPSYLAHSTSTSNPHFATVATLFKTQDLPTCLIFVEFSKPIGPDGPRHLRFGWLVCLMSNHTPSQMMQLHVTVFFSYLCPRCFRCCAQ